MNIRSVITILLLAGLCPLRAQRADSLITALARLKVDSLKAKTLLSISEQDGDIRDLDKIPYAEQALALSKKLNYRKGIIGSHIILAKISNNLGKMDDALDHLATALRLLPESPDKSTLARIYNMKGVSYYLKGDYPTSLSWYLKSLALYEELNKEKEAADIIFNMSVVYYIAKRYDKASQFTSKAAAVYKKLNDTLHLALAETQRGNIAYDQYQYDTALVYFERGLKITENLKDQTYAQVSLNGIGDVLFETGQHEKALVYHRKALYIARKTGDDYGIANVMMNLGREYAYVGKFSESEKLLKEAIDLSKKTGTKRITCDAYSYLAETYEMKKDYKEAMKYSFLYAKLRDTLFNEENASLLNDLTTKYENEKKEKAIALLNAQLSGRKKSQELLNAKVEEKNIIIFSVIGGTILILVSAFLLYSRQKLRQKNQFQAELNKQQKEIAGTIIQMLENERNRIARELHDGIGTYLSTLKINLQVLERNVEGEKLAPYKNNGELIDRTSEELRRITKGLSNEALQEKGLSSALQEMVNAIHTSGAIQIQFLTDEAGHRFDPLLETNYYRVAQELINNSIKHSRATKVNLQLIDHDTDVLLMLEDNGIGFDLAEGTSGMGLKNIRNRIDFLGGTFKIESVLEKGSTFIIEVPKKAA